MSRSLKSLKGVYVRDYIGVIKGDARSLDYSSFRPFLRRLASS